MIARRHRRRRGRARRAAAVLRRRPDRPGHDRDREGPPLRRGGGGRGRREPLHRRGRVRPDRGRVRAAAGRARPVRGARRTARRSCTRRSAPTSPTSARSRSARSTGRSPTRRARCRRSCAGRARPACRWTRTARSATTTAGTGVVTIYANSMNFTYFLWLIAGSLKIPASKLQRRARSRPGGSFGSKFFMHKVPTFAGLPVHARRAAR